MKFIVVCMLAFIFSGCGLQNQINDLKSRSDQNEGDIRDIKSRIAILEGQMTVAQGQLVALGDALGAQGANLTGQIAAINVQLSALATAGAASDAQIAAVETQVMQAMSDAAVLAGRVSAVENTTSTLGMSINDLQDSLASTNALMAQYVLLGSNAYSQIQGQIAALQSSSTSVSSNVTVLQSSVTSALVQIAVLQGYNNIVSIKDPCGAQGSYNEVFLKLSTGQYLASFSDNANGLNTRFTLLTDGSFVTTDGSHCYFTVSGSGTVISDEHN